VADDDEEEAPSHSTHVKGIFGRPYTARDVFRAQNEQYIKFKTTERYGDQPGGNRFVGHYQQMITELFKQFKEDEPNEFREVEKEAELWNRRKPPKEEQQKYVSSPLSTRLLSVKPLNVKYKLNNRIF
jgi:hypothetical protein